MRAEPDRDRWRMCRVLPPALEAVDRACAALRERLEGGPAAADWFALELLLREALTNAVLHGCAGDPARRVRCEVRVNARSVRIDVSNDGPGFDWRAAMAAGPGETATSGRGLRIYAVYADRVSFDETGNRLVLVRRLPAATEEADDVRRSDRSDRRPRGRRVRR